jgi:hypothetical protein
MSRSKSLSNKEILDELLKKQLPDVTKNKLSYEDIRRLSKYIKTSIFNQDCCSIWNGYITNTGNESKGIYINFYYNSRKVALHRILYSNYIGNLTDNEYLKFSCENKGRCCNIKHIQKFQYVKKNKNMDEKKRKRRKKKRIRKPTTLTLSFD